MAGSKKKTLVLFIVSVFLGCSPGPTIDMLAPSEGKVGDVIDIRDPVWKLLGTRGSVSFGLVPALGIRKWTNSDIYVEVPEGISGTVFVSVMRDSQVSGGMAFLVLEWDTFPRVMSFGDSLTYWGCAWVGWTMKDDPYLSQFDPLHINQGTRGEKVTDGATLVRWQDALSFCDCDFAVLMHGANDLTDSLLGGVTIPMVSIQQSVINMIDAAASTDTDLILCTLPPRVESCGDIETPTTEEYNAWLRTYAGQQGVPLVDIYDDFISTPGWEPLYFGGQCLHPNVGGHQRIAELVNEKILELALPTCTDLDTDGYGDPAAPPCPHPEPDCDDSDPDIHPGIIEASHGDPICSDGLDNDCDGDVDLADGGCQECFGPEDCDDGLWCNGEEACAGYVCQAGSPPDCDDAISCSEDSCNEGSDACDNLPNDTLCDDSNLCTNDVCNPLTDCDNACNATGPEDPCCQDPVCSAAPVCNL